MAERSASRAALLSLRRERQVMEEGYRFLDEKRVALAHELLRRLRDYQTLLQRRAGQEADARTALAQALERHGLEELQVYPAAELELRIESGEERFLGQNLVDRLRAAPAARPAEPARWGSAQGERCAAAYRALLLGAPEQAAAVANLLRLMAEYRRTERRVRALENIVLPEARQEERRFESALEELDQEEIMRSRLITVDSLVPASRG